jgi:hypothetical protein
MRLGYFQPLSLSLSFYLLFFFPLMPPASHLLSTARICPHTVISTDGVFCSCFTMKEQSHLSTRRASP